MDRSFLRKETDLHIPPKRHMDPPNLKSTLGEPSKCLSVCWARSGTYLNFIKYKMKWTLFIFKSKSQDPFLVSTTGTGAENGFDFDFKVNSKRGYGSKSAEMIILIV